MEIHERIRAETQFKNRVKARHPNGHPRARVGSRVNTIHGVGIVVGEYCLRGKYYPYVQHDSPAVHIDGEKFDFSPLAYYSKYEYEKI